MGKQERREIDGKVTEEVIRWVITTRGVEGRKSEGF